jgi:fission process protein 1
MALPAFTIHQTVAIASKRVFKNTVNPRVKAWGPTLSGLAVSQTRPSLQRYLTERDLFTPQVVPFLPFLFDKPVEHAVDYVFEKIEHRLTQSHAAVQAVSNASRKLDNVVDAASQQVGNVVDAVKREL